MHLRNRHLKVLRERHLKARSKKEKPRIPDEYGRNTSQARKYIIRKIPPAVNLRLKPLFYQVYSLDYISRIERLAILAL